MAKGKKTGGRHKGVPNKTTADARAAVAKAFETAGGVAALGKWATENQESFYTRIWVRTIPEEQRREQTGAIEVIFRNEAGEK